jgi:hypothetical protein
MAAMLDARYAADGSAQREQWYLDNWGAVAAEIGAAQQITPGAASHQLLVATALRDRLPRVGAVFTAGLVTYRTVAAIVFRTMLISDLGARRAVDAALARALAEWEPMSVEKLTAAIDYWVDKFDPHAVRRTHNGARSRSVDVFTDGADGLSSLSGNVFTPDAQAFDARLDALAATTCGADPRTKDQRRADALGALAFGHDRLVCRCAGADCPANGPDAAVPPAAGVVIHVVVNDDTLDDDTVTAAAQDASLDGEHPPSFDKPLRELTVRQALRDPDPGESSATRPGAVMDGGRVMAGAITRRLALTAVIRRIVHPHQAPPESRYVPSAKLAEFVRCRDLTCRYPGCDEPATKCDLDHTIPYPVGPTQASNLKCLCRKHHLLKTFWGWLDRQLPDGTVIWTAPSGRTHTTTPGSRLLFPTLCTPTAPVTNSAVGAATARSNGGLTMPRRPHTRAEGRARRIDDERRLNQTNPPAESDRCAEPAPF